MLSPADRLALPPDQDPAPWQFMGGRLHRQSGTDGTRFVVWAPHAQAVSVVGDFNQWDDQRHPMRQHTGGLWVRFIPGIGVGTLYKYAVRDAAGQRLPFKADPWSLQGELRPANASVVAALPKPRALPPQRAGHNDHQAAISIYEVHAPSWRAAQAGAFPSWQELADHLPAYAAQMGFTHIELMPISEYPFDGSWGYQTLGLFAPSARFGDPQQFQVFVDKCHELGLGVILDWVPAHFPMDEHGLAAFDGTALYEHPDPREGYHRDWNTYIYQFGHPRVRQFLQASALYWLTQRGVDGLRVDAVASMLYRDYSRPDGEWVPNQHGGREHLEAIALLQSINTEVGARCPQAMVCAEESTSFPGVTRPVHQGGLGFHFKWNMGWMNDTLRYMQEDPIHRKWHHDKLTFGLTYAFNEHFILPLSHDEVVHGKGSLLQKMPGDEWQQFANLRAYYGFMWGHPGKKLLFMGQEFGQAHEWQFDRALPWQAMADPKHAGIAALVRDLNGLLKQHPALHAQDSDATCFEWLVAHDTEHSVLAWVRHATGHPPMMVVCNFTPVPRHGYRIPLRCGLPLRWRVALNTDHPAYGGSGVGPSGEAREAPSSSTETQTLSLTLPPLATVFLTPA